MVSQSEREPITTPMSGALSGGVCMVGVPQKGYCSDNGAGFGAAIAYGFRTMDKRLLEILCCPASKQPLRPLSGSQLDALNRAIAAGGIATTAGAAVDAPLRQGLMTADGKLIYRVEDDIPVMLVEEAIGTTQLQDFPA